MSDKINRREIIQNIALLTVIPYISTKYKTPQGYQPFEKLTNNIWEEYPFDELQVGDIVRRQQYPKEEYEISYKFKNAFSALLYR